MPLTSNLLKPVSISHNFQGLWSDQQPEIWSCRGMMKTIVCVCWCFGADPRNMRWWPEGRPLLTQPHYWWKSTAGDNLTSCSDTPLTPLIWFHNFVENLCRIGLNKDRLLGDNPSSKLKGICGNWATICISWNLAGDTLFIQVFTRNIRVIVTAVHHSSPTIWELPSTQEVFASLSTPFSRGKIGGSTDFNWHWTTLGHWSFCAKGGRSVARSTRKLGESHFIAPPLMSFHCFSHFGQMLGQSCWCLHLQGRQLNFLPSVHSPLA